MFTQDELTPDQYSIILEVIHGMLPDEIRILRNNGYDRWVCVYVNGAPEAKKVSVYSPREEFDSSNFTEDDLQTLDETFGTPHWLPRQDAIYRPCFRTTRRQDEFLVVLAFALCLAMGQMVSAFHIGIIEGDDDPMSHVRGTVVGMLLDGKTPLNTSVREIWKLP